MKCIDPTPQSEEVHSEPTSIPIDHLDLRELHKLTEAEKHQHLREGIFRALELAGKEARGQPPRVDRFREVARVVEQLEAQGVPFGVCSTSIMNQRVRNHLNEKAKKAKASNDPRKSRTNPITAGAVRKWLRDVRYLRQLSDSFTKEPPYTD